MKRFGMVLAAAVLAALTACAAPQSTADSTASADSAAEATAAPDAADSADTADGADFSAWETALDGCVAYEADTAGGSLKTAKAAAALVEVAAENGVPANLDACTAEWRAGLNDQQTEALAINWDAISTFAHDLASEPDAKQGELADAGVTTDFSALDLTEVPAALDVLDAALA